MVGETEHNPLAKKFNFAAIMRFTIPNMIMMVFTSMYTIIDGMFISRYAGEIALSATNMYYPVMSLQWGLGIMIGSGGSAIIALKLGRGDKDEAREDLTTLTLIAGLLGLLFGAIAIPFINPILRGLGTSDLQMAPARIYAIGTLIFSPMMFLQMVFQIFFVTAGKPKLCLALTVAGGIANIILDWLFMGPLQMGIMGAALATGIGWSILGVAGIIYFSVCRTGSLFFTRIKYRGKVLFKACTNGSSEMVSNVAIGITTFIFNLIFMKFWAEAGIAAITIMSYYQFVFNSLFLGFTMGIAPVISFKYGAGDHNQLKKVVRDSLIFVAIANVTVTLISILTIEWTLGFFTDKGSDVYNIVMSGFKIYVLQFLFAGMGIFSSGLFTALNNGLISGIISFGRTFLFLVGTMIILPIVLGELGVWLSVPLAEGIGCLMTIIFLIWGSNKYHY